MGENYPDNVFIFGAGCSVDAGIPMLSGFIDRMRELASKKKFANQDIPREQTDILIDALHIIDDFESYASRALFDYRNIEDILSLLHFEKLAGCEKADANIKKFTKAIAATIEYSCLISPSLNFQNNDSRLMSCYAAFWNAILKGRNTRLPGIISFNYDLVFERSLFRVLSHDNSVSGDSVRIDYGNKGLIYEKHRGKSIYTASLKNKVEDLSDLTTIPFYKLHGSLNLSEGNEDIPDPMESVQAPVIMPPVFNKTSTQNIDMIWRKALKMLRNAKNICIVGYSLPDTDIYMQYFFRSGVGPNHDLNKIMVFNPVLFQKSEECRRMKERFSKCFSSQILNHTHFEPENPASAPYEQSKYGKFDHFVKCLLINPGLLYY